MREIPSRQKDHQNPKRQDIEISNVK